PAVIRVLERPRRRAPKNPRVISRSRFSSRTRARTRERSVSAAKTMPGKKLRPAALLPHWTSGLLPGEMERPPCAASTQRAQGRDEAAGGYRKEAHHPPAPYDCNRRLDVVGERASDR